MLRIRCLRSHFLLRRCRTAGLAYINGINISGGCRVRMLLAIHKSCSVQKSSTYLAFPWLCSLWFMQSSTVWTHVIQYLFPEWDRTDEELWDFRRCVQLNDQSSRHWRCCGDERIGDSCTIVSQRLGRECSRHKYYNDCNRECACEQLQLKCVPWTQRKTSTSRCVESHWNFCLFLTVDA